MWGWGGVTQASGKPLNPWTPALGVLVLAGVKGLSPGEIGEAFTEFRER